MIVVQSIEDLQNLPLDRRVNGLSMRDAIAFDIPSLARHHQIHLELALNRYQSRCGCGAGAACFVAALGVGGAYITHANHTVLSLGFLGDMVAVLLAAFMIGLAGKLVSLEITRLQFAGACRRYWKELSTLQGSALAWGQEED